jgi:acetyltransferase-like isoleucine patch superfamily enzyme
VIREKKNSATKRNVATINLQLHHASTKASVVTKQPTYVKLQCCQVKLFTKCISIIEMNKIKFVIFINITNNTCIFIKTRCTALCENKINLNLSTSIQRVFTLKCFIIMNDINDEYSQKVIKEKYSHIKIQNFNYDLRRS